MLVDSFGGTDSIFGWLPTKDIRMLLGNRPDRSNVMDSRLIESVVKELVVPVLGVRVPEVSNSGWKRVDSDWKDEIIVDSVPACAPRGRPNGGVAIMYLDFGIVDKILSDLHHRGPKSRSWSRISCRPKRHVMVVFGFENSCEKRILVSDNIVGGMND